MIGKKSKKALLTSEWKIKLCYIKFPTDPVAISDFRARTQQIYIEDIYSLSTTHLYIGKASLYSINGLQVIWDEKLKK